MEAACPRTNLGVLSPVIGRRVVGGVGGFVLQLGNAGEDVVDGFLALSRDDGDGLQLVYQVLEDCRVRTASAAAVLLGNVPQVSGVVSLPSTLSWKCR